MNKTSVLFVCLGNICRSPLAEGIFRDLVEKKGEADKYIIESSGTGTWHIGQPPHPESIQIAKEYGIDISSQKARHLADEDFFNFDYIIAMDQSNLNDINDRLISLKGEKAPECFCLRQHDPEKKSEQDISVPDPYYEGGFDGVFKMIERSLEEWLKI